jgi:hypothetical protein
MSLVTAKVAVPDFVASAWLVAVTCTVAGDGRSAGAVYTPAVVIVPSAAFPPATPLTLQLTAMSVVFLTVAAKVTWLPSTTVPLAGVTLTTIEAAEGGGGAEGGAALPAQPHVHAVSARMAMTAIAGVLNLFLLLCERDCMPSQKQAKGQRRRGK